MPLPNCHPFGHVNLNVCPGRGPRPLAVVRPTEESLSQWGQVCICCSSAQGGGNSRPSPPRPLLPANWAGSSGGQKKTINCVAQVEKKTQKKINEKQKTKNSRNILKRRERNCESSRATECAGNQYATKAICQRPRPNAHCAYLAHLLPAHWRCKRCEVSWAELSCGWAGFMAGCAQK